MGQSSGKADHSTGGAGQGTCPEDEGTHSYDSSLAPSLADNRETVSRGASCGLSHGDPPGARYSTISEWWV